MVFLKHAGGGVLAASGRKKPRPCRGSGGSRRAGRRSPASIPAPGGPDAGLSPPALGAGSAVVAQVHQPLGSKLLPAQGTLRLGAAPLGDALPAEEVAAGRGRGVPALLQAQRAQGAGNRSVFQGAPVVGQVAVQPPLLPGALPLPEAVQLQPHGQRQVQQGEQPQQPVARAGPQVLSRRAAGAELSRQSGPGPPPSRLRGPGPEVSRVV